MTDDMSLPKRLSRLSTLNEKLEAGEKLTEDELKEYMEHTRAVNEWAEGFVEPVVDAINELVSGVSEVVQPLSELEAEHEYDDDS